MSGHCFRLVLMTFALPFRCNIFDCFENDFCITISLLQKILWHEKLIAAKLEKSDGNIKNKEWITTSSKDVKKENIVNLCYMSQKMFCW
ncbi:hypothetical protein L2E82_32989 [Cichorium intybus]|uniref:Uncharacterized protein n=1 Tax=Cichorium intybus TaxID=13427 RepID=A0ACB9BIZ1_CICIN|nr:hypothetical protein L2E82_32989 [Cichorium intybus]